MIFPLTWFSFPFLKFLTSYYHSFTLSLHFRFLYLNFPNSFSLNIIMQWSLSNKNKTGCNLKPILVDEQFAIWNPLAGECYCYNYSTLLLYNYVGFSVRKRNRHQIRRARNRVDTTLWFKKGITVIQSNRIFFYPFKFLTRRAVTIYIIYSKSKLTKKGNLTDMRYSKICIAKWESYTSTLCNSFGHRKWIWQSEFKSWMKLFLFPIGLMLLRKAYMHLFSPNYWQIE